MLVLILMAMNIASELKAMLQKLDNYSDDPEPIEELKRAVAFTEELQAGEQVEHLSFLPSLVTSVLGIRVLKSEEAIDLVGQITNNTLQMLPVHYQDVRYLEAFRMACDFEKPLFSQYRQEELSLPLFNVPDATWVASLEVETQLDAVKMDIEYDRRCWSRATVSSVDQEGFLTLQFEDEGQEFDRTLHRTSNEIAPLNSYSAGDSWRSRLATGSLVDVYDTASIWYNSTVLDTRTRMNDHGGHTVQAYIGYRVYEPNGDKHDERGAYRGWSCRYDEWLSVKSPRIAPSNLMGRRWAIPVSPANEEQIVDDSNDVIETYEHAYCVPRPKNKQKSKIFMRNLNDFGKNGLFAFMIDKINDAENPLPFEVVYTFAYFMGKCYHSLHKLFAMRYVPQFKDKVFSYFLNCPVSLMRDFQREKFDLIKQSVESLLKRVHTIQEKNAIIEDFLLEVSFKFFATPYLERRIHGLRVITESIKSMKISQVKVVRPSELVRRIQAATLLESIFGPNGHVQLIQRSGEVIKLLASEGELTVEQLRAIWESTQTDDEETKQTVYKVLREVSLNLKAEHIDVLATEISSISPSKLRRDEIDLLYELTKFPMRAGIASHKSSEFLFGIALKQQGYSSTVVEFALEKFTDLMKSWELRKNRVNVIMQCIEKLRDNQSAMQCLQITKKLLLNFGMYTTPADPLSRPTIIENMVKEYKVLQHFFDNLRYFKSLAAQVQTDDIQNYVVCDYTPYKEQIEERLSFLLVILTGSYMQSLTQEQMDILWELLMQNALCRAEREVYLKWLAEVTEQQNQGKRIFDDKSIHKFFVDKIANSEKDFTHMSTEEFTVFRSYFLLVNVSLRKIKQTIKSISSSTDIATKEFEYSVLVPPISLEGSSSLRQIILQTESQSILSSACEFNNQLYDSLHSGGSLAEIREEFVSFCLEVLQSGSIQQKCRALSLLKGFMEECDKQGTGGLKSHNALLKGDIHVLTIHNSINYYPQSSEIPKKIELKLYSNTTIWELRQLLGQQVKCLHDQFKITISFTHKEIGDADNGKTLSDLKLRSHETIYLYRRSPSVSKAPLLTADNHLTPRTEEIFRKMFRQFADKDGKMSAEGCAAFTNSCTGDPCKPNDRRIQEFFLLYDDDKDSLLTEDNFLEFYRQSCLHKQQTVWTNLGSHHYRNDLRRYDDSEEEITLETLPGYILTRSQANFDLLFAALNEPELAALAWELIVRLPTNPQILNEVQELSDSWALDLQSSSRYKLLYVLQIVDSFMEDAPATDSSTKDFRSAWKLQFLEKGGFQQLYSCLLNLEKVENSFEKQSASFLLKLICMFILASFSAHSPDIYEVVELVRKNSEGEDDAKSDTKSETKSEEKIDDKTDDKDSEKTLGKNEERTEEAKPEDLKLDQSKPEEKLSKYQSTRGFAQLVEDISLCGLAESILGVVDFEALLEQLIGFMAGVLERPEFESEDKHIIDSALELFVSCLMHKPELMETLYTFDKGITNQEFTIRGITYPRSIQIRKAFAQSFKGICEKIPGTSPYYLRLLVDKLPLLSTKQADYTQYFEALCDLIERDLEDSLDYPELIRELCKRLREHPYNERRNTYYSDKVLVGLLNTSERIFRCRPELKDWACSEKLPFMLFEELLFPPSKEVSNLEYDENYARKQSHLEPPKAKARETRGAACRLVSTLCRGHQENLHAILPAIEALKAQTEVVKSWNYAPASDMRSSLGYAGIINLGCICYMNAMLQQFYMIPTFRYGILAVDDGIEPTNAAYLRGDPGIDRTETGVDVDDNMLHQLQYIFGYLELTDRQAYNPSHFCYSFKDFTGRPTNISIQEDAQEFLNMLFDRLENALKPTPFKDLTQSIFGGRTSNQIICKECNNIKENFEDFYNLSVDVKNSKTLFESLDKFIAGDLISNYHCDTCDKEVEITKRTVLDTLPNFLIVHLQRIVYSFDTLSNEKINTRLEFPHRLNLFDYTKLGTSGTTEEVDKSDFEYELVGICVQTGTAQVGHYYSFIRDRLADGSADPEKWLEFNDNNVRTFNPGQIEAECFGGQEVSTDAGKDKSRNAYMLVYEKLGKRGLLEGDSTASPRTGVSVPRKQIPREVYQSVLRDNQRYMFERNMYSPEYFQFMTDILRSACDTRTDFSLAGASFAIDIVSHALLNRTLSEMVKALLQLFQEFPESCASFLKSLASENLHVLCQTLLVCSEKSTRTALKDLYAGAMAISETGSTALVEAMLSFVPQEANKHWSRFQQFWEVFSEYAVLSEEASLRLLNSGIVSLFLDYYLGNKSPLALTVESRQVLGNKMWSPAFDGLIRTVATLSEYCSTNRKQGQFELSEEDKLCLLSKEFFDKTLRSGYDCEALGRIVAHWAWEDIDFSRMIAQVLLKGLNDIDYEEVKGYYSVLQAYFTIEDSLTFHRIEWMIGFPAPSSLKKADLMHPAYGVAHINAIDDEVVNYITTLSFGYTLYDNADTILTLLWKHKKRWDYYCIMNIKFLLEIALKNPRLADYINSLPAPTYQYAHFSDWIEDYIVNYQKFNSSYTNSYSSSLGHNSKKEEYGVEAQSLFEEFRKNCPKQEERAYVIASTVSDNVIRRELKEGVQLTVIEYINKWVESKPDGKRNQAVPWKPLRVEMNGFSVRVSTPEDSEFEEAPLLLVFEVINKSSEAHRVQLKLSGDGNYRSPITSVSAELAGHACKDLLVLSKIDPLQDWGSFEFEWSIEESCPFNIKGDKDEYLKESSLPTYYPTDDINFNVSEIGSADEDLKPGEPQKHCPSCTLLNDANAKYCSLCRSPFP